MTTVTASSSITPQNEIVDYLKHFGVLAALGAASVLLVAGLQVAGTFNISTLPIAYQGIAFLLLPIIVAAGMKLKTEIDAQIQAEMAAKQIALLQHKNADLEAKNMQLASKVAGSSL